MIMVFRSCSKIMLFVKEKTNSPKIVTDYRLKAAMKEDYD